MDRLGDGAISPLRRKIRNGEKKHLGGAFFDFAVSPVLALKVGADFADRS
jgi:hypothetical protein